MDHTGNDVSTDWPLEPLVKQCTNNSRNVKQAKLGQRIRYLCC